MQTYTTTQPSYLDKSVTTSNIRCSCQFSAKVRWRSRGILCSGMQRSISLPNTAPTATNVAKGTYHRHQHNPVIMTHRFRHDNSDISSHHNKEKRNCEQSRSRFIVFWPLVFRMVVNGVNFSKRLSFMQHMHCHSHHSIQHIDDGELSPQRYFSLPFARTCSEHDFRVLFRPKREMPSDASGTMALPVVDGVEDRRYVFIRVAFPRVRRKLRCQDTYALPPV